MPLATFSEERSDWLSSLNDHSQSVWLLLLYSGQSWHPARFDGFTPCLAYFAIRYGEKECNTQMNPSLHSLPPLISIHFCTIPPHVYYFYYHSHCFGSNLCPRSTRLTTTNANPSSSPAAFFFLSACFFSFKCLGGYKQS